MAKNNKLAAVLHDLGLSENEAKVYLAALSLRIPTPTAIAKSAGIRRTTTYSVIESLQRQGLINIELKGLKNIYVAENPEKLRTLLESRKDMLEQVLPEFSALYNLKGSESLVKYYEGFEATKSAYESLLAGIQPHEDYLVMGNIDTWYKLDPTFFQNFIERRAKLPINVRLILEDTPFARKHQEHNRNYNMTVKVFPKGTTLHLNTVTTPQKTIFHQLIPPIRCLVIENKFLIEAQQQIFNLLWDTLP